MSDLLSISNLTRTYGNKKVLDGLDLKIGTGKIVGLLAPNGEGKTTLFRLMAGLLTKNDGEILIDGQEPSEITNSYVSFLPDHYVLGGFHSIRGAMKHMKKYFSDFDEAKALSDLFKSATGEDKLEVSAVALGADQLPAFIRETEEARRMAEMRKQFEAMRTGKEDDPYKNLDDMFPVKMDLVLNTDHPLVLRLRGMAGVASEKEKMNALCQHIYDQARLAHGSLDAEGLKRFLKYNSELLTEVAEKLE